MNKLTAFLEKYLLPIAVALSKNTFLRAIMGGFSLLLPITMIGAIFTLLANLQIGPYQAFIQAIHLKEVLAFAPKVTTEMLALYAVFLIAKSLAEGLDLDDKTSTIVGALALLSFLLLIPLGASGVAKVSKEALMIPNAITTTFLGSPGLFTAIIVGLTVPVIYNMFIKYNLLIKMPDQVPPIIAKSFNALIPAFAIALIFGIIRLLFSYTSFGHANAFIYSMLKVPLSALGASPLTYIVFILMCSLMWFFGIHGGMVVQPFLAMLYTPAGLENLNAYSTGTPAPNIITDATWSLFASLGGAGGTCGLCMVMLLTAKSARYKTLSKIAAPAGVCGINEPLIFGLPMVLNTIMIIPMIITPIITFLVAYFAIYSGIVPELNGVHAPLGTPVVLSGLIAGGWQTALLQIVLVCIQMVIYIPFFKVLDNQELVAEQTPVTE